MTGPAGAVRDLAGLLGLRAGGADRFEAPSVHVPGGPIFGGQLLAQAARAAAATVGSDRRIHALHGHFLRAGDVREPVTYDVETLRDGRSFSARHVVARQRDRMLFSAHASFQVPTDGPSHHVPAPIDVPGPGGLAPMVPYREPSPPGVVAAEELLDVRPVPPDQWTGPEPTTRATWVRARGAVPADPALHDAVLAYLTDAIVQIPVLAVHGLSWWDPGIDLASIDHTVWWYAPARVDDWMLAVHESPVSGHGRGVGQLRIYRDDDLLAVAAQELTLRHAPSTTTSQETP